MQKSCGKPKTKTKERLYSFEIMLNEFIKPILLKDIHEIFKNMIVLITG